MSLYAHWRDVPTTAWRWPNFSPAEIACRSTGTLLLNEAALNKLQALRSQLGKPMIVRSAYRSPEHNRAVGGAKASKHLEGIAFDIAMANHDRRRSRRRRGRPGSRASASIRDRASSTSISGRRAAGASGFPNEGLRSRWRRRRHARCWPRAAR